MKKLLLLLLLLSSGSLFAQRINESPYDYYGGQTFIGGDLVFGKMSDYSGALLGASFGRNITSRFAVGIGGHFLYTDMDESIPVVSAAPFARYNFIIDGPVAVYAQANLALAVAFVDSESYGVLWPNISGGMSYRLSRHFTAFAQMGLLSSIFFTFGSGMSDSGSGSGSGSGYDGGDSSIDLDDYPIIFGFTRHPSIGIYYTF